MFGDMANWIILKFKQNTCLHVYGKTYDIEIWTYLFFYKRCKKCGKVKIW